MTNKEQSIYTETNLGMIVTVINKYGCRTSYFANEVLCVSVRTKKVWVLMKGCTEELWVDDADTEEEATKIAEQFLSCVGTVRMNGPDQYIGDLISMLEEHFNENKIDQSPPTMVPPKIMELAVQSFKKLGEER
jgi:hypothetical protein